MATEGSARVVDVCWEGMDKGEGGHAEVSLSVLEEKTRAEGTAAAAAVVAP